MPFSFKPEISQTTQSETGASMAQTSLGGSAQAPTMMARVSSEGKGFFQGILFFIFFATLLVSLGMFGYSFYLSSQVESKKATLSTYESRLGSLPLEEMRKLSNRIKIINGLVKEHPSVNAAFRVLEDSVENNITYTAFELKYNEQGKSYALQLTGNAPSYRSIAQQVDTFKRKPYSTYISSVAVEGLQPNERGSVSFIFRAPIMINGLTPETLNLSEGAAARVASTTPPMTATGTMPTATGTPAFPGTLTPGSVGSSSPQTR